ncbi:hypothetical protein [Alkaliphilus sp. B6464]|uniref:hypothetical protein n=1 Tax=Alkaliphilus sp. B6464 TaxID=2731219 RepID=UPI001BA6BA66|nr:hypothetical protein [Alkaliphilus sp. B6464]QUH19569.1 hypothetical protein HYG84_06465 [Alkaliphilus sp. B6464]
MSIQSILSKFILCRKAKSQCDCIELKLEDLYIKMNRITDKGIPHEVTVVVPRAEIREKYDENQRLIEKEVILNSITIVHAPRHPLAGPPAPPPEIPAKLVKSK